MFRTELRKFLGLYNLKADITRPELAPDNARARWTITTQADDWQTHTTYDFLRWEDVIAKDFTRAPLWVIVHGLITLADVIRVEQDKYGVSTTAVARPRVDFQRLEEVLVLIDPARGAAR